MSIWTDDINGEPDTSKGVSPVRRRVLGDPAVVIQKGAGCLAYLVTTNIKADGKRIPLHNLARNQLMKASMEIERQFSLIKAEEKLRLHYSLKPVDVQRVLYGKAETKRAITNVLDHVLPAYKYASLAELNAVLKLYNVLLTKEQKTPASIKVVDLYIVRSMPMVKRSVRRLKQVLFIANQHLKTLKRGLKKMKKSVNNVSEG